MNLGINSLIALLAAIIIGFVRNAKVGIMCMGFSMVLGLVFGLDAKEILSGFSSSLFIQMVEMCIRDSLNVLVGLVCGYLLSIIFTVAGIAPMVDFSGITKTIEQVGVFSLPKLVFFTSHKSVFDLGAFFTIAIVFLVSAAETTGATTAV